VEDSLFFLLVLFYNARRNFDQLALDTRRAVIIQQARLYLSEISPFLFILGLSISYGTFQRSSADGQLPLATLAMSVSTTRLVVASIRSSLVSHSSHPWLAPSRYTRHGRRRRGCYHRILYHTSHYNKARYNACRPRYCIGFALYFFFFVRFW